MNIFILDENPTIAARMQCDRHVVKMIIESAQMLSTAHRVIAGTVEKRKSKSGRSMIRYYRHPDDKLESVLYKGVHYNHPCTQWTHETDSNYMWHYDHFIALCNEYTYRYNRRHATDSRLRDTLKRPPKNIPIGILTPFRLAMNANPECINESDPVGSYRKFYQTKQTRFDMRWTNRNVPCWFIRNE